MAKESIPSGQRFNLSTGGNKLNKVVGTPENKSARANMKQISLSCIFELVGVLELSKTKTDAMCQNLRKNIADKLNNMHDSLSGFYECKKETFTDHGKDISRTLVYATNPSDLIIIISRFQERNYDGSQECNMQESYLPGRES